MNEKIKDFLIKVVRDNTTKNDPSHDINHVLRVLAIAEKITKEEGADLEVVIPASLFHDIIVYQKNDPRSKNETEESAEFAADILKKIENYPSKKIERVKKAIKQCSFSKGIVPDDIESKILQDADRLEATGAISIMRTFSSGGQMNVFFYNPEDPFCQKGECVSFRSCIDLFYQRLLVVEKGIYTKMGKQIAKRRTKFLVDFLDEFKQELKETGVI